MHDLEPERLGAIPTTTGMITGLACEWAQAAGIEPEPLLKEAGLTKQHVENADARLSVECQVRFLNLAASALQDELLGFHLGQQLAEPQKFGLLYYVAASSDTLGEALRRVARYGSMVNEGVSPRYLGGKDVRIVFNHVGFGRHLDRHQIECWLTMVIRLCRKLTGCRVEPSRVTLIHHRTGDVSELVAFLGCDIKFGAAIDEMAFAAPIAAIPIVSADPYLNKLLIAKFEEAHSDRRTKRCSFRSVVEKCNCSVVAARERACQRSCFSVRFEPTDVWAPAYIGEFNVLRSPERPETRPCYQIFGRPWLVDIANCLASRLSGSQRVHRCI